MEKELELLPIATEVDYIADFISRYMTLWNRNTLSIVNKNTAEDKAFIEIYNHHKEKLGELKFIKDIKELDDNSILIDTDTLLLRETKLNYIKFNYTLNIFIDYSPEYVREILKFYKIDISELSLTDYGMNEDVLSAFRKYLSNELDIFSIDSNIRRQLIDFLKQRNQKTNKSIMNSYNLKQYNTIIS